MAKDEIVIAIHDDEDKTANPRKDIHSTSTSLRRIKSLSYSVRAVREASALSDLWFRDLG